MRRSIRRAFFCSQNSKTNFGYQKIDLDQKQEKVNDVFHSVASNYDLMNDVLSLGTHRCWKNTFVQEIGQIKPERKYLENGEIQFIPARLLDVAGGTGDIAFKIIENQKQYQKNQIDSNFKITCLDINDSMLGVGRQRAFENNIFQDQIEFVEGNAESLQQYEDNTFDLYTISFGLRNVPKIEEALKEAYRVLKPGGRFMCLEFSKVQNEPLDMVYKAYNANILPFIGSIIAKDDSSYRYLAESIDLFHDQETLIQKMDDQGFKFTSYKNLSFGICALHSGFKL